jgi:hypothetical protein
MSKAEDAEEDGAGEDDARACGPEDGEKDDVSVCEEGTPSPSAPGDWGPDKHTVGPGVDAMRKTNVYFVVLLLISAFAVSFTRYLDGKAQQLWGANWMGSAEWAHTMLYAVTSVCVAAPILAAWRAVYFKKWPRSK